MKQKHYKKSIVSKYDFLHIHFIFFSDEKTMNTAILENSFQGGFVRLAASKSNSEKILTGETVLYQNIMATVEKYKTAGESNFLPKITDIASTHYIPVRASYQPVVPLGIEFCSSRATRTHEVYKFDNTRGEYIGAASEIFIFRQVDSSTWGVITDATTEITRNLTWSLVNNFAIALVKTFTVQISGTTISNCSGTAYYVYCNTRLASKKVALDKMQNKAVLNMRVRKNFSSNGMTGPKYTPDSIGVIDPYASTINFDITGEAGKNTPIEVLIIGDQIEFSKPWTHQEFTIINPVPFQFFTEVNYFLPVVMFTNFPPELFSSVHLGYDGIGRVDPRLINIWAPTGLVDETSPDLDIQIGSGTSTDYVDGAATIADTNGAITEQTTVKALITDQQNMPNIHCIERYLVYIQIFTPVWFANIIQARGLYMVTQNYMTTERVVSATGDHTIEINAKVPFEEVVVLATRQFKRTGRFLDNSNVSVVRCPRGIPFKDPLDFTDNDHSPFFDLRLDTSNASIYAGLKSVTTNALFPWIFYHKNEMQTPILNDMHCMPYSLEYGKTQISSYYNASNSDMIRATVQLKTYSNEFFKDALSNIEAVDPTFPSADPPIKWGLSDRTIGAGNINPYIIIAVTRYINIIMFANGAAQPRYVLPNDTLL